MAPARQLLRDAARTRLESLRALALPVVQTSVAAALAWYVAHDLIGHPKAFFAPIAATVAIGLAAQQYIRRVGELTLGVAVGIAVADAIVRGIGSGTWQLAVVVFVSMGVAVVIGGGALFITQAAVQAILVTTLPGAAAGSRFVDALVGGAIGLAVLVASPPNPMRVARRQATAFFGELALALDEIADALERRDVAAAREALAHARAVEPVFRRWVVSLRAGREKAAVSPPYWHVRPQLDRYEDASEPLDHVVRNVRVLARGSVRAAELDPGLPTTLPAAIRSLAEAVREADATLDRPDRSPAIEPALRAVALATEAYAQDSGLPTAHVVGQIRSAVTDLLTALGLERSIAVERVRGVVEAETAG
jgi:uncharacterized membrane protein YgaE (UPF0421/DUF939 family)